MKIGLIQCCRTWQVRGRRNRGRHGRRRHGPPGDASAQASVAPDEATLDRALASDPALTEAFEVAVLGRLAASQQQWTRSGSVVSTLEVELGDVGLNQSGQLVGQRFRPDGAW